LNLLGFAGVTREGPAAHKQIDERLSRILAVGVRARERLRKSLRDPKVAGKICKALGGCEEEQCLGLIPAPLVEKVELVPVVVRKIEQARKDEAITTLGTGDGR
jgi:hypothetical protein